MSTDKKHAPFAKRSLGQNYLVDGNICRKIVGALGDLTQAHVIEIGPGRGALTDLIAEKAKRLTAVELDSVHAANLASKYQNMPNVLIVEADALETDLIELAAGFPKIKLAANLPYNISTPILQRLTAKTGILEYAVVMLQKEVVERITAPIGNSDRGFLTVMLEAFFTISKLFDVAPNAFRPVPRVWSAVVRLTPVDNPGLENEELFRKLVSIGFRQKRKTILNNLKSVPDLDEPAKLLLKAEIDPGLRPEMLSVEDWKRLVSAAGK